MLFHFKPQTASHIQTSTFCWGLWLWTSVCVPWFLFVTWGTQGLSRLRGVIIWQFNHAEKSKKIAPSWTPGLGNPECNDFSLLELEKQRHIRGQTKPWATLHLGNGCPFIESSSSGSWSHPILRQNRQALETEASRRKGIKMARVESSKRLDQGWSWSRGLVRGKIQQYLLGKVDISQNHLDAEEVSAEDRERPVQT